MSASLANQVEILIATSLLHTIQILTKEVMSGPPQSVASVRRCSKTFVSLENMSVTFVQWLKGT